MLFQMIPDLRIFARHLNKKGLVLFGDHTHSKKVSLETENFKSIEVNELKDLNVSTVIEKVKEDLN